jgi:flagellar motor switch protein FliG
MQLESIASLRKAAVLIASLDTNSADRLLEQMGPDQAARVRRVLMQLGDIDEAEQEEVLAEFFGRPRAGEDSVELSVSEEAARLAAPQANSAANSSPSATSAPSQATGFPEGQFAFLEHVPANELYEALQREHPQTIALVIACMAPAQGAAVLRAFSPFVQSDILTRLERSSVVDAEALESVERHLRQRFEPYLISATLSPARRDHLASLRRLLESPASSTPDARTVTLANHTHASPSPRIPVADWVSMESTLAGYETCSFTEETLENDDPSASYDSAPGELHTDDTEPSFLDTHPFTTASGDEEFAAAPQLEFEALLSLTAADFFAVFEQADSRIVMLALAGASRRMFDRFVARFTAEGAAEFERHLEQLRPFPLSDVLRAQQALAEIAARRLTPANSAAEKTGRLAAAA